MSKIVSTRRALHSSEYHERKKKENRFRGGIYLFVVIVALAVPVILLRLEKFRVNQITISGNVVVPTTEVERVVRESLAEMYLWVIPKDNDLLIPRRSIKQRLLSDIPRIQSLDINILDTDTLGISIQERAPAALYCNESTEDVSLGCYFLDDTGFIFAKSPDFSGEVYFIYTGGDVGLDPVGRKFLPQETFDQVSKFISDSSKLGLSFKSFEFRTASDDNRAQFRVYTADGVAVYWYSDESLEKVYSTLATLISSGVLNGNASPLDNILYLDLTLPNKPYWKNR